MHTQDGGPKKSGAEGSSEAVVERGWEKPPSVRVQLVYCFLSWFPGCSREGAALRWGRRVSQGCAAAGLIRGCPGGTCMQLDTHRRARLTELWLCLLSEE